MINRLRAAAAVLLIAVAGNCGDSTLPDDEGVMRFEYSGARSGSFVGRGREARAYYVSNTITTIVAAQVTGGTRVKLALLLGQSAGTYTFRSGAEADVIGTLSFTQTGGQQSSELYSLYAGTATITEITSKRVRGRFDVSARGGPGSIVTVTGGTFDVPLGPEFPDFPGS